VPRRKSDIVDGYSVCKAAQRAEEHVVGREEPAPEPATKSAASTEDPIGKRIGRTVMPTRHHITCYECGFEFQLTGAIQKTYCAKCRAHLTVENVNVDGDWKKDITTAGTVHIRKNGVVQGGAIQANQIIVEGAVQGGSLSAFTWLELRGKTAIYDQDRMKSIGLRIGAGATLILPELHFHNIEVVGVLRTRVVASGCVHVRPGGLLEGEVCGQHLAVDDGGGLRAKLHVIGERLAFDEEDDEEFEWVKTA